MSQKESHARKGILGVGKEKGGSLGSKPSMEPNGQWGLMAWVIIDAGKQETQLVALQQPYFKFEDHKHN